VSERGLFYLTSRDKTGAEAPEDVYGDARNGLSAGWCGVREVDFGVLSPLADAAADLIPDEFLRLRPLQHMTPDAMLDALLAQAADRPVLLYTHGFYISFEKGCRRATLLQENAGFEQRFLWFSWPSDGALLNYTHDEADLYWSVPDIADAIISLENRVGGDRVHIAGHSLGGRGMVLALYEVANRHPDMRLGDLVLLAPDMDFQIFGRMLPRIRPIVRSITVYVTSGDRPLALSAQLNGYPRLGESGNDVSILEGVEVIDLSDIPSTNPSGHLYHIYSSEVGADLRQLLNEGKPAAQRRNLVRAGTNLWRLQPAE
jgi:esterase/lipase superfamily enzyme